jgi:hypothetical protein
MRAARSERARFLRASAVGALLAALPFTWLLAAGRAELGPPAALSGFYDAQAHSFLDLRWDVPAEVLSVEAFTVDGRSYMYFGPTPALLRLPVAALTDRFDGRLTQVSMLLAAAVALASAARLSWRVRALLGPPAALRRVDLVAAGSLTFLLGAGSTLLSPCRSPPTTPCSGTSRRARGVASSSPRASPASPCSRGRRWGWDR